MRKSADQPVIFKDFRDEEIELMAQLEHGRWNIEPLRAGWRLGKRDDEKETARLFGEMERSEGCPPEGVKRYDRNAANSFPDILAKAGLEVFRK